MYKVIEDQILSGAYYNIDELRNDNGELDFPMQKKIPYYHRINTILKHKHKIIGLIAERFPVL